jgi:hypothetical protein
VGLLFIDSEIKRRPRVTKGSMDSRKRKSEASAKKTKIRKNRNK